MRRVDEPKTEERVIEADEISEYQEMGWRWKGELSSGRFVMEREIKPIPPIKD